MVIHAGDALHLGDGQQVVATLDEVVIALVAHHGLIAVVRTVQAIVDELAGDLMAEGLDLKKGHGSVDECTLSVGSAFKIQKRLLKDLN